jgi:phage-related baseplate assembly protein
MALPIPIFIERDPVVIVAEMKADYEARTGRTLEPAQVEQLLINAFAYRELLIRNQIQDAALQNLVAFARFPMLDYLGELVGVVRLTSQPAQTTLLLTLVTGHGDVVIPSGLRVSSTDGRAIFELIQDTPVLAADDTVEVIAVAQTNGELANDYAIGTISVILDPQPYLETASNTTVSESGSDEENDDALRERIRLAPNSFSTAGPYKAYEYWARTASPLIIDVAVDNRHYQSGDTIPAGYSIGDVIPGTVEIFPLVEGLTTTPPEILTAVETILNADRIRPLNDVIFVTSPTAVNTDITVGLTLYDGAVQSDILPIVQANLEAFRDGRRKLLGQDIVISQIKALCIIDGVYDANVTVPASNLIIGSTEFANITDINVTVTGTNEG